MALFMNKELIAIRDNLVCNHCGGTFKGSDYQAYNFRYKKTKPYCSKICRRAGIRKNLSKPAPFRGDCKGCGKPFYSKTSKIYCSMDCYTKSDQFSKMLIDNSEKNAKDPEIRKKIADTLRNGENVPCIECGEGVYKTKSNKRKFCSTVCYRSYMAKRFDRWIANPEDMALPQCYDEFLDREELNCIIDGCDWHGRHLSGHVQLAHGIKAREFKRAAGFNYGSGLVCKVTAKNLSNRAKTGIATGSEVGSFGLYFAAEALAESDVKYSSLEGKEHKKKAALLRGKKGG